MYAKIMVPTDGSATADKALDEAVRLAQLTGGSIRLLHVVDPLEHLAGLETAALYLRDLTPTLIKAGEELLAKAKENITAAGVMVETELSESPGARVAEVIIDRAQHWGADLIVLGTHGRRGFERVMLGSDAEQVVRISPLPVLLVRYRE